MSCRGLSSALACTKNNGTMRSVARGVSRRTFTTSSRCQKHGKYPTAVNWENDVADYKQVLFQNSRKRLHPNLIAFCRPSERRLSFQHICRRSNKGSYIALKI